MTIRLFGINAPEMKTPAGPVAKSALIDRLISTDGSFAEVTLFTIKDKKEKYGRYLGTIVRNGINLNEWLVENGYAVIYQP